MDQLHKETSKFFVCIISNCTDQNKYEKKSSCEGDIFARRYSGIQRFLLSEQIVLIGIWHRQGNGVARLCATLGTFTHKGGGSSLSYEK